MYCHNGTRQISYTSVMGRYNFDSFIEKLSNLSIKVHTKQINVEKDATTSGNQTLPLLDITNTNIIIISAMIKDEFFNL